MSDLEATSVEVPPEAPDPVEGEAPPPAPEPEEKEVSDDDLKKAFTALNRKKSAHKGRMAQLHQDRSRLDEDRKAFEQERRLLQRLKDPDDDDALREARGDDYFDRLVEKRLNPEATAREAKLKEALAKRDEDLQALKKRLDEFDQRQAEARAQQEESKFLGYIKSLDAPELDVLDEDEVLGITRRLVPQFREEAGRNPTFGELGKLLIKMTAPKVERLKKRLAPPPAAPPPGKKGAGGLTNRDASTPSGASPDEDPEVWRDRLARQVQEGFGR